MRGQHGLQCSLSLCADCRRAVRRCHLTFHGDTMRSFDSAFRTDASALPAMLLPSKMSQALVATNC